MRVCGLDLVISLLFVRRRLDFGWTLFILVFAFDAMLFSDFVLGLFMRLLDFVFGYLGG